MNYTQDEDGKWIVYMDDVVLRRFDTEGEAQRFVSGDDTGTADQDAKVTEAYHDYLKRLTGIDLLDPHVKRVDTSKIKVTKEWHEFCVEKATGHLTKDEKAMFFLLCIGRIPHIVDEPYFLDHDCVMILEEGALEYA